MDKKKFVRSAGITVLGGALVAAPLYAKAFDKCGGLLGRDCGVPKVSILATTGSSGDTLDKYVENANSADVYQIPAEPPLYVVVRLR